jgi:hypothetical protein
MRAQDVRHPDLLYEWVVRGGQLLEEICKFPGSHKILLPGSEIPGLSTSFEAQTSHTVCSIMTIGRPQLVLRIKIISTHRVLTVGAG